MEKLFSIVADMALSKLGLGKVSGVVNLLDESTDIGAVVSNVAKRAAADLIVAGKAADVSNITSGLVESAMSSMIGSRELWAMGESLEKATRGLRKDGRKMVKSAKKAISKKYKQQARRIAKLEKDQEKARALIERYEAAGWTIPETLKERANRRIKWNISAKEAETMHDLLTKRQIDLTRRMDRTLKYTETDTLPEVIGTRKDSAGKIYNVTTRTPTHDVKQDVSLTFNQAVDRTLKQIRFVMEKAPSRQAAESIYYEIQRLELASGVPLFKEGTEDQIKADILGHLEGKGAFKKAIQAAESKATPYPGTASLLSLYDYLVNVYGVNDYGIAAKQIADLDSSISAMGDYVGEMFEDRDERENFAGTAMDILQEIVNDKEFSRIWNELRKDYKMRRLYNSIYQSDDFFLDVSDIIITHPGIFQELLKKLKELMRYGTNPRQIINLLQEYADELIEASYLREE